MGCMHNRRQGKDEASISYFYDKVRLCKELNLPIEAIKRQVAIGLWSKDLAFQIVGKSFNDVDDILAEIQMYEKVDKSRRDNIRAVVNEKPSETKAKQGQGQNVGNPYYRGNGT